MHQSFLKKFLPIFFFLLSFFSIALPMTAHAEDSAFDNKWGLKTIGGEIGNDLPFTQSTETAQKNISVIVGNVIKILLSVLGLIFVLLIIYGGLRWMLARGDSGAIEEARDTMVHAVIGLVIILSAYTITNFVFDQLALLEETG